MYVLRIFLLPFSIIYFALIQIRFFLYKINLFKSFSYNIPVVKIGNILSGGTGKTPVTKFISDYFLESGLRVCIVSRGYKRSSKGMIVVYKNGNLVCDIHESGDELFMLANQFNKSPYKNSVLIIASEDRNESITCIEKNKLSDIVILDDAFQNYSVNADLDIAIVTRPISVFDKLLLPAGNLRETKRSLKRADVVIFNKKFSMDNDSYCKNEVVLNYRIESIININGEDLDSKDVVLVCGIGDPASFKSAMTKSGLNIVRSYIFNDHYFYNQNDVKRIFHNSDFQIVSTEKDFYKLISFANSKFKEKIFYAKLELNFPDNYSILKYKLDQIIENKK